MKIESLEVMYNSMKKGPNVKELESYWKNYAKKKAPAVKKEKPAVRLSDKQGHSPKNSIV